jgi:hypothetical protein
MNRGNRSTIILQRYFFLGFNSNFADSVFIHVQIVILTVLMNPENLRSSASHYKNSLGSVIFPVMQEAASVAGEDK